MQLDESTIKLLSFLSVVFSLPTIILTVISLLQSKNYISKRLLELHFYLSRSKREEEEKEEGIIKIEFSDGRVVSVDAASNVGRSLKTILKNDGGDAAKSKKS